MLATCIITCSSVLYAQDQNNVPSYKKINIRQYKLSNGFTVILNEDHTKAEVVGVVVAKAGSKNDPADATGMAHYQEHMLFKGTETMGTTNWNAEKPYIDSIFMFYDSLGSTKDDVKRKEIQQRINGFSLIANQYAIPNELSNLIKSIGGTNLNASTGPDQTLFYNSFPPGQIEKWLDLYSKRFINPVFRSFQAELEVVYEEKNLYSDMFQYSLLEEYLKQFFKVHPYGQQSTIGTIEDLKNPSLTKMYQFFKTNYVANNMGLVLSGDFSSEEIIPIIEQKFGILPAGTVPENKKFIEEPFNDREFFEKELSPIKLGVLGFRTVPNGHPDEIALDLCHDILSNQNQTGLLDKLSINNKLLAAALISLQFNDYGGTAILIVPKIVGQSLENAEELVMAELDSLRSGKFPDWMIDATKNRLYLEYESSMESNEYRSMIIASAFSQNRDIIEYLSYPEKLKNITREDIIRVANEYYGKNYLAFYSKRGSQKNEKIDKPGYQAMVSNTTAESEYAVKFAEIPVKDIPIRYIDFSKDVIVDDFSAMNKFRYTKNPKNTIFSLTIQYGAGDHLFPKLKYASDMMNYSGTSKNKVNEIKKQFSMLGCTYSFSSDESYTTISLKGIESNLGKAMALLNELVNDPVLEKDKIKMISQGEMANRKMERSEPDNVAYALFDWIRHKEKSDFIDRLSIKKIKKLEPDELTNEFKKVLPYECTFYYTGTIAVSDVKNLISTNFTLSKASILTNSPVVPDETTYNENTIYLINKKKALQSKIYFYANGEPYDISAAPHIDAFNLYFGGDFSGLILQEVREYRSLAYSAGAGYGTPPVPGKSTYFMGYIGTQCDKTIEAVDIFDSLYREMPQKSERMEMIRQYLIQSAITSEPDFRSMAMSIEKWKRLGYESDPLKSKVPVYRNMKFDEIVTFYNKSIKTKPLVIGIVGDTSRINLTELAKYGKIIEIKEGELFSE
jgi:predicted Zn-dependent peptidase